MDHRSVTGQRLRAICALGLAALGSAAVPPARGADAHQAVQAKPGEIVLLRNVATRPAYRAAPPGMALIVNPSPQRELDGALGVGELSDDDYANLGATPQAGRAPPTTVEAMVGRTLGDGPGTAATLRTNGAASGMGQTMAAPMGAIAGTARGIGDQVQGALSALPGMSATPGGGR